MDRSRDGGSVEASAGADEPHGEADDALRGPVEAFEAHRGHLFGIAYGTLGTVMDAEDVLQDAWVRWQEVDHESVESPKKYLGTVVGRLAIDRLRAARNHRETYPGSWLPQPVITEERRDPAVEADRLTTAFLHILESLAPRERVAYLLREVFGYEYEDVARIVEATPVNCRKIVSRARKRLERDRPRFEATADEAERLTRRFLRACGTGDIEELVAVLDAEVTYWSDGGGEVPAARRPVEGSDRVVRLLLGLVSKAPADRTARITEVNGRPGVVVYYGERPYAVLSFRFGASGISDIYAVIAPSKLGALAATGAGRGPDTLDATPD